MRVEVDNELVSSARGSTRKAENYLDDDRSQPALLRALFTVFSEIEERYIESIAGDNRLVGVERSELLDAVALMMNLQFMLWATLFESPRPAALTIRNRNSNFFYQFHFMEGYWEGHGQLTTEMFRSDSTFTRTYHTLLSARIKKFLTIYRDAVQDRFIDDSETLAMRKELKQIVYYTLYLFVQIENCVIDN